MRRDPSPLTRLLALTCFLFLCACENRSHVALGSLERDRIALTATEAETVTALPISEGRLVKTGDLLVQLNDAKQRAQLARAQANLAQAEANMDKLRNGAREEEVAAATAVVVGARATLRETQRTFERNTQLAEQKLISQADADNARLARDTASADLQNAQEQLRELTNGTRAEDLRAGEAQLQAAQAEVEHEQRLLEELSVVATRDGILDSLPWNLGERVTVGSPVAIVLADANPYARVYIPEPARPHLQIGQILDVQMDGIDTRFRGTVRWLSKDAAFTPYYALNESDRSRLVYLAEIQLGDDAADLPTGMPVQVHLP